MANITTKSIRNVCLLGHGGSGKTSLCEAMLYLAKETDRLGRTPEGNTVSDYDPEEIRRGFSLSTTVEPLMWQESKINILDTPGYLDFTGEVLEGMRVADSALIVVDGRNGVEVGTELAWDYADKEGIPRDSSSTVLTMARLASRECSTPFARSSALPFVLCSSR